MKNPLLVLRRSVFFAAIIGSTAFLSQTTRADDYGFGNYFGSGTGTWQDGGGTPWGDFQTGISNLPWDNTLQNDAVFFNPVTDTVVGTVDTTYMYFVNPNNTYTIQGGTINKIGYNLILENAGASDDVVVTSQINVDTAGNTDRFNIVADGANSITDIESPITFFDSAPSSTPYRSIIFNANNSTGPETFILNGVNTSGTTKAINLRFNEGATGNATLLLKGDYTTINGGDFIDLAGGTVILDTSLTPNKSINSYNGVNDPSTVHSVYIQGAQTFNGDVNISNRTGSSFGFVTVGNNTADIATYNGNNGIDNTDFHVTAATNGRVNFNGVMYGTIPDGLVKTGNGTVVISGTNTYGAYNFVTSTASPLAADLQTGITLIKNTSGSAFGNNTSLVNVEAGATLGGNGISTQTVVAVGANSIIAPGDPGQANLGIAPTTGTLTLAGGLEVDNGATLNFKINGLDNDKLSFASGDFTPTGTLTINLLNMGGQDSIASNHYYTLIDPSAGTLDPSNATVNVIAPYGYAVEDVQFGTFTGLEVELLAAPEPSTYALMLGGLGFLVFCIRRKSRA